MKQKILTNFNNAIHSYDTQAHVQKTSAQHLISMIPYHTALETGKILDVGAGTGFVTGALSQTYPQAHFFINDIAPHMLAVAHQKLNHLPHLMLHEGDAEVCIFPDSPYDLITANLSIQWFDDWQQGLKNLLNQTHRLVFSIPIKGTFHEWQMAHDALGLKSGLHPYPSFEHLEYVVRRLNKIPPIIDRKSYDLTFNNPKDFVIYLKSLGAHTPHATYTTSSLQQVLRSLTGPLKISYEIFYAVISKENS